MTEIKIRAFILRTIQTQEADLIVKVLTQKGEKLTLYARAALKSKKRFEGGLRILNQVELRATKKQGQELGQLEETHLKHEFKNIGRSIELLAAASYLLELTDHCSHEGLENAKLYNLLGAALKTLDEGKEPLLVVAGFEAKLLMIMGWQPDLEAIHIQHREVIGKLLKEKLSELSIPEKEIKSLGVNLKEKLLTHIGKNKLKSLDFLSTVCPFF